MDTYGSINDEGSSREEPLLSPQPRSPSHNLCEFALRILGCLCLLLLIPVVIFNLMHSKLSTLAQAGLIGVIPSIAMLVGGLFIVAVRSVNEYVEAFLQNFSAGIIITAVGCELFPLILEAPGDGAAMYGAIALGFAIGILLMFGIGWLIDADEDEDEDQDKEKQELQPVSQQRSQDQLRAAQQGLLSAIGTLQEEIEGQCDRELVDRKVHELEYLLDQAKRKIRDETGVSAHNKQRLGTHLGELHDCLTEKDIGQMDPKDWDGRLTQALGILSHVHDHVMRTQFRRWKTMPIPSAAEHRSEVIPWALVVAVTVDACVDGFLIGTSYVAEAHAGKWRV